MVALLSMDDERPAATMQTSADPQCRVERDNVVTDFSARVVDYFDSRSELEKGLPALIVTNDPAQIRKAVRALQERIRLARAEERRGEIFTPTISREFRKALTAEMNDHTWAAIMDDNPGEFSIRVNGTYPEGKPLSTVPPNILAALPRLPDDIQYRFVGRHLILLDTRAYVILDWIPFAIDWPGSTEFSSHR
jgi:hypothetical protein